MKKRNVTLCMLATVVMSAIAGFGGAYLALSLAHTTIEPAMPPSLTTLNVTNEVFPAIESTMAFAPSNEPTINLTDSIIGNGGNRSDNPIPVGGNSSQAIPTLVRTVADTVVEIDTERVVGSRFLQSILPGAGSGVIISEDGYIITNNHVIENLDGSIVDRITVRLRSGETFEASVVGRDPITDLAVLKIETNGLPAIRFADSSQISVGEMAVAIGNPLGNLGGTVTEGIISALNRDIYIEGQMMNLLQTSAAVNPGNSGGGLFNAYGELIGIVNAKYTGADIEGIGFAIPSNTVRSVSMQLINYGHVVGRVAFGIELTDITNRNQASNFGVTTMGLYVVTDDPQSGLMRGDRIISIAGINVSNRAQARAIYLNHNVGDVLEVAYSREGRAYRTQVALRQAVYQ